jgi:hypothetical protein
LCRVECPAQAGGAGDHSHGQGGGVDLRSGTVIGHTAWLKLIGEYGLSSVTGAPPLLAKDDESSRIEDCTSAAPRPSAKSNSLRLSAWRGRLATMAVLDASTAGAFHQRMWHSLDTDLGRTLGQ